MKQLTQMMQQAQQVQRKMEEMQAHLEKQTFEGQAGAGLVTVTLNGKGDILSIKIDPSLVNPNDIEMLEDLLVAAINDGRSRVSQKTSEEMSRLSQELKLPGGMKLPF